MTFFVFPWIEDVIISSLFKHLDYANDIYFLSTKLWALVKWVWSGKRIMCDGHVSTYSLLG